MKNERLPLLALAVFLGGAIGGACRFALILVPYLGGWPAMTVFINCLGTLVLSTLGAYLKSSDEAPAYWQAFIGTGFCGGFTTFSTLMLQDGHNLMTGHVLLALFLLVSSIILALGSLAFGQRFGNWLANWKKRRERL